VHAIEWDRKNKKRNGNLGDTFLGKGRGRERVEYFTVGVNKKRGLTSTKKIVKEELRNPTSVCRIKNFFPSGS